MALLGDRALQTSNNPGTSTFNLIAPPPARLSFVTACGIGQVYYIASDGTSWEVGFGTVASGSPDTLTRDTVIGNSLGTTAKINFTSLVTLFNDIPAERDVWANAANDAVLIGGRKLSGLLAGVASDDGARLDQVAAQQIGAATSMAGLSGAIYSLPSSGYEMFDLEWRLTSPSTSGVLFVQFSINNRASFDNAAHYGYSLSDSANASSTTTVGGYIPVNNNRTSTVLRTDVGKLRISTNGGCGLFEDTVSGSVLTHIRGGWNFVGGSPITDVVLTTSTTAFASGSIRLTGWKS